MTGDDVVVEPSLYERIRNAILNGEFRPGATLREAVLAERHGVSRTPVREALRRLEQDGVLERVGRQLRVKVTTPEEVLEIYECRIVLEGMAAEWAARNRNPYDLARLEHALERMERLNDFTPVEMSRTNHAFHERMWRASHNSTLHDLLTRMGVHVRRYPEPTVSQPRRWPAAIEEHRAIVEAIRAQDPATAGKLSSQHMAAARDLRLHMIRNAQG